MVELTAVTLLRLVLKIVATSREGTLEYVFSSLRPLWLARVFLQCGVSCGDVSTEIFFMMTSKNPCKISLNNVYDSS